MKSSSRAQDSQAEALRGSVRTQEGVTPTFTLTPSPRPPWPRDSRGSHLPQAEEGRRELVADKAPSIGVQVPPVDGQPLCNVPQLGLSGLRTGAHAHPGFHPKDPISQIFKKNSQEILMHIEGSDFWLNGSTWGVLGQPVKNFN